MTSDPTLFGHPDEPGPPVEPANPTPAPDAIVCPHLGLRGDRRTHYAFPSSGQACHAGEKLRVVDATKQARDCLTADHAGCRYYAPIPSGTRGAVAPVTAAAGPDARPAMEPVRTHPGAGRQTRRRDLLGVLGSIALLLLVGLVGLGIGGVLAGRFAGAPDSPPAVAPTALPTPQPTLALIPTPIPSLQPTPAPTLAPAPTATSAPSASPSPSSDPTPTPEPSAVVQTHKIRRGESLTTIALLYGVTPKAIQKANGIKDPNLIVTGQVLVIPGT